MLRKLAEIAQWLDAHQMYESANMIDDVIVKTAQSMIFEPDMNEPDDEDDKDIWRPEAFHSYPEVHAASPEFLELLKTHNPQFFEKWVELLRGKGFDEHGISPEEHTGTHYFGGRRIHLPRGFSKTPVSDLAHFVFPEGVLARNEKETLERFRRLTRDHQHRATFEGEYVSSTQPSAEPTPEELMRMKGPKTYVFDPYLLNAIGKSYDGKGLPVFDPAVLRQIFDPTDVSEAALKMREKLKDKPFDIQAGYPLRILKPAQMFGLWRKKREIDQATGKKRPNFYLKTRQ